MISRKTTARSRLARRKKGFTLTEIAIVLGIIGLILGAIWVAAASVYNAQRLNHATTATLQIAQGVRSLYATSSSTGVGNIDMTPSLITANVIPNDLIDNTVTPPSTLGPFPGGKTFVIGAGDSGGFTIVMSALNKAACTSLLVAVGGTSRDPGLFNADAILSSNTVAVGDAPAVSGTGLTTAVTPPVAAGTASPAGPSGGMGGCTNTLNKVRFGFTLK